MKHPLRICSIVLTLGIFLAGPYGLSANASQRVQIEWRVITASHKRGNIDPRLRDIYRDLGSVFNYGSYRLIDMNRVSLTPHQEVSVPLSATQTFVVKVTGVRRQWVHARIQLLNKGQPIFGTTVQLMNGRTLLIGGPTDHGKTFIFSLRSFW